jgi:hypothetical protein
VLKATDQYKKKFRQKIQTPIEHFAETSFGQRWKILIAKRIGLNNRIIDHYFASKEDLHLAIGVYLKAMNE